MERFFDSNYIKHLAEEISKCSSVSYDDFPSYNLFLSQVTEYLNDKFIEENFTNNIIQNYIKNEVISKPEEGKKRGYTKTHLIQLVLLSYMRPLLTTEESKRVFKLAFNEINDMNDDILSWEETYKTFTKIQEECLDDHLVLALANKERLDELVKGFNLRDKDEERIRILLLVLSLILKASAIKKLIQKIVNEYHLD